jgi:hyperosmotically inducible protein
MKNSPLYYAWVIASVTVPLAIAGCSNNISDTSSSSTNASMMPGTNMVDTNSTNYSGTNYNGTNYNGTNADNTGRNVRDRNDTNATPLDQGNSEADINITKMIRESLMSSTNNYSVTAQNIKIITQNGKVTLRGPVTTDAEKASIDATAKQAAGDANVDDQLEVKAAQ